MQGPIATVGSMHVCPMLNPGTPPPPHVGGPVTGPGAPGVTLNGKPIALMGDMCVCMGPPDTIVQGSMGVTVNGVPVVTLGCLTAHGGTITTGEPGITITTTTPSAPAVMPTKNIPFPKITPILKTMASLSGRRAQLNEAIENQEKLKEEAEGDPRIFNLQWVKEDVYIRDSKVVKEVTLRAQVQNISDGENISFHIKKPNADATEANETEEAQVIELSGTVQDKMVEVVWEMEDASTSDPANEENS